MLPVVALQSLVFVKKDIHVIFCTPNKEPLSLLHPKVSARTKIFRRDNKDITQTLKNKRTMKTKFFKCQHCGNVIVKTVDSGVPVVCCGEKMEELIPGTVEASVEKHLPVVKRLDECRIRVEVGSVLHPMQPEHHIAFVYVETEHGGQLRHLSGEPVAEFCTGADKPVAVYEYCNLHGLWKTELPADF